MRMNGLGPRLEELLSVLFEPLRAKSGAVSTKRGLPVYSESDHIRFCGRYLGGSFSELGLLEVRTGGGIYVARSACLRAVERYEGGLDVEIEVQRDYFRTGARALIRSFEEFGGEYLFDRLELIAYRRGAVDAALLEEARTLEQG
jgi:hypothetical protein